MIDSETTNGNNSRANLFSSLRCDGLKTVNRVIVLEVEMSIRITSHAGLTETILF